MKNWQTRISIYLAFLLGIVFSIKCLREPDLWWQIRSGEWILQHKTIPHTDVFSYTMSGQPWFNVKWGAEVICAWVSQAFGPECIPLLQAMLIVLILWILKNWIQHLGTFSAPLFLAILLPTLLLIEFRMTGRPEMYSHLFSVLFTWILVRHSKKQDYWLYTLIPLQALWANLHEAFGMGIAITLLYVFGQRISARQWPRKMLLVLILQTGGILLNPRGWKILTKPFDIFNQLNTNKFTTELASIADAEYWSWQSILFLVVLIAFIFLTTKKAKWSDNLNGYFLVLLGMLVLGVLAQRNLVFFVLLSVPWFYQILSPHAQKVESKKNWIQGLAVLVYLAIVSNMFYRITYSRDRYGLEVLSTNTPVSAGEYLQSQQLKGQNIFSDYLTSSYLLWKLQPDFKSYIDLRDLDVFSTDFFTSYFKIANDPKLFHQLDEQRNFQTVVLFRNSHEALHRYLYTDTIFACVFADPVAAVYRKTDHFNSGDVFSAPQAVETGNLANLVATLFNPFYQSFPYESLNVDLEAARYYLTVGRVILAENRLKHFLSEHSENSESIAIQKEITQIKSKMNGI